MDSEKKKQMCHSCGRHNGWAKPGEIIKCGKCKARYEQVSASIVNTPSGKIIVKKISISARVDKGF